MSDGVRVPIQVKPAQVPKRPPSANTPAVAEAVPPVVDRGAAVAPVYQPEREHGTRSTQGIAEEETLDVWRDRALRLQAEMENFRKRQRRLAEERVVADRERLLRSFLHVADDLERALTTDGVDAETLRQGVDLTYHSLMRLLDQEGVEPIQAEGQPFDPAWHEAVGTVPHQRAGVEPDTVVEAGYRLGDRLLRPARVIVAA